MKFVVCSDLHLGGSHYRKHDQDTLNVYMLNNFNNFKYIVDYCSINDIDFMVIPGDVFDRSNVSTYALYESKKLFDKAKEHLPLGVYAVKGNHDKSDILDKKGFTAIDLLDINSYHTSGTDKIDDINFVFVPWGEQIDTDLIDHNAKYNILVTHAYPKDYFAYLRSSDDEAEDVLKPEIATQFDMVLTGHYHSTDEFIINNTKFINPGSISPSTSTKGHEPCFFIVDTNDLSYQRINIPNAMKIIYAETKNIDEYLNNIQDNNIYRIKSVKPADKLALIKAQRKATDIQITVEKVERKEIKKIDDFWDFIHNDHPEYEKEFRDIVGVSE